MLCTNDTPYRSDVSDAFASRTFHSSSRFLISLPSTTVVFPGWSSASHRRWRRRPACSESCATTTATSSWRGSSAQAGTARRADRSVPSLASSTRLADRLRSAVVGDSKRKQSLFAAKMNPAPPIARALPERYNWDEMTKIQTLPLKCCMQKTDFVYEVGWGCCWVAKTDGIPQFFAVPSGCRRSRRRADVSAEANGVCLHSHGCAVPLYVDGRTTRATRRESGVTPSASAIRLQPPIGENSFSPTMGSKCSHLIPAASAAFWHGWSSSRVQFILVAQIFP